MTSLYTEAVAAEICERISAGETLASISRDEHMPKPSTVGDWCRSMSEFAARYAKAREIGYDAIAADCLEIADETAHDTITTAKGEIADSEWIARSRLRVDTRLKLLAKWDPKRYGEKIDVNATHTGEIRIVVGGDTE